MTLRRALAASCAIWLAMGSAQAADTRAALPPGYSPDMSTDEAGLWMAMDKEEAALKTSANLVRDEKLNAYVSGVICKLAADYCPSIRVYIVDTPAWNASCAPNGMVVVYTGLLLQMKNEAQFSFVLGHEITHYTHRHSLDRLRKVVNTAGFLQVFNLAMAGVGAGVGADPRGAMSLGGLLGVMSVQSFTRDQEREADDGGFQRAVALGMPLRKLLPSGKQWRRTTRPIPIFHAAFSSPVIRERKNAPRQTPNGPPKSRRAAAIG